MQCCRDWVFLPNTVDPNKKKRRRKVSEWRYSASKVQSREMRFSAEVLFLYFFCSVLLAFFLRSCQTRGKFAWARTRDCHRCQSKVRFSNRPIENAVSRTSGGWGYVVSVSSRNLPCRSVKRWSSFKLHLGKMTPCAPHVKLSLGRLLVVTLTLLCAGKKRLAISH